MNLNQNPNRLDVYSESRKRRVFVGKLTFYPETKKYQFEYDIGYMRSKSAIPLGPELGLRKKIHVSEKGKLFPSFLDRIPLKENAAYVEYCESVGISPNEKNLIILLATIGKRGPSTFVFESVLDDADDPRLMIMQIRKSLTLSQRDIATAFDLNLVTYIHMEQGRSKDKNVMRLLAIYSKFPEVALDQLLRTGSKLHQAKYLQLLNYYRNRLNEGRAKKKLMLTS